MSRLIEAIQEKVVGRAAIRDRNLSPLSVMFETESGLIKFSEAHRMRLSIMWASEIVCKNTKTLDAAKQSLVEHFKYAIYKDMIELIYRLEDAVYRDNYDDILSIIKEMKKEIY